MMTLKLLSLPTFNQSLDQFHVVGEIRIPFDGIVNETRSFIWHELVLDVHLILLRECPILLANVFQRRDNSANQETLQSWTVAQLNFVVEKRVVEVSDRPIMEFVKQSQCLQNGFQRI